jgi:hypothetical protein
MDHSVKKVTVRTGVLAAAALVALALPGQASAATVGTQGSTAADAASCSPSVSAPRVLFVAGKGMVIQGSGSVSCTTDSAPTATVCIESALNQFIVLGCTTNSGTRSARATGQIPCVPGDWLTYLKYSYFTGSFVQGDRHSGVTTVWSECASA